MHITKKSKRMRRFPDRWDYMHGRTKTVSYATVVQDLACRRSAKGAESLPRGGYPLGIFIGSIGFVFLARGEVLGDVGIW